jgi:hypothetical protein
MRLAVAMPSLEATAPQRLALDAVIERLVERGVDVEGFAEHDRVRQPAPCPLFHYLRMPERHHAAAFDTALYPLGRDASPYQGVYTLMERYPAVVWFLDSIAHHLAVGGIALMGDWAAYRELLDRAYDENGAPLAQTVASNWGTGAVFRRYDLVRAVAARQSRVLAAWPALAERIAARLQERSVEVIPLGLPREPRQQTPIEASAGIRSIAVMTVNESYATSAVRAAAAVLELDDRISVTVCLSEPIYKAEGRRVAEQLGVHQRVDWQLTTSPRQLARVASDRDMLVWLAEELQGGHRLLLLRGMGSGKMTVVPRCSLYDDLPEGAVAKLDLGRAVGPAVSALLRALNGDAALRRGLSAAGRAFAAGQAGPDGAAELLLEQLEAARAQSRLDEQQVAAPAWANAEQAIANAALPAAASPEVERHLRDVLRAHIPGPER